MALAEQSPRPYSQEGCLPRGQLHRFLATQLACMLSVGAARKWVQLEKRHVGEDGCFV